MSIEASTNRLRAFLVVPFWLPCAPKPMRTERRETLLENALQWLDEHRKRQTNNLVDWRLVHLEAWQQPRSVTKGYQWGPREIVARKRALLVGDFRQPSTLRVPNVDDPPYRVLRRSLVYYDYGLGCYECEFEFELGLKQLVDAELWRQFTDKICDAVVEHRLDNILSTSAARQRAH